MFVGVITGSDVNLGALQEQLGINVVPDYVIRGERSLSSTEADREEFLRWMREGNEIKSSHPTVQDLLTAFTEAGKDSSEILYIPISSKLSKAYDLALALRKRITQLRIEVFDPERPAGGHSLITLKAARLASEGHSLDSILTHLNQTNARIDQILVVDSLRQLTHEGRISNPGKALGSLVSVKALLALRDGLPTPIGKVRTNAQALEQISVAIKQSLARFDATRLRIIVDYADNEAWADQVAETLNRAFSPVELLKTPATPMVILRLGLGGWSVAWETVI